jgi:hypothetical protein
LGWIIGVDAEQGSGHRAEKRIFEIEWASWGGSFWRERYYGARFWRG